MYKVGTVDFENLNYSHVATSSTYSGAWQRAKLIALEYGGEEPVSDGDVKEGRGDRELVYCPDAEDYGAMIIKVDDVMSEDFVAQRVVMKGGRVRVADAVYKHTLLEELVGKRMTIYRDDLRLFVLLDGERRYLFG